MRNRARRSEPCLGQTLFESGMLVLTRSVGIQKLVVQAFLSPGSEGAVDERNLDEEVDAVVQARLDERRRGELEDSKFELERESVAHLESQLRSVALGGSASKETEFTRCCERIGAKERHGATL